MDTDEKILKDYVADLHKFQDQLGLTDWEKDFIGDMISMQNFSLAQGRKILQIAEKYDL